MRNLVRSFSVSGSLALLVGPAGCAGSDNAATPGDAVAGGGASGSGGSLAVGGHAGASTQGAAGANAAGASSSSGGSDGASGSGGMNACVFPHADCDQVAETGCETNVANDPKNCGDCGSDCGTKIKGANVAPVCQLGTCAFSCLDGYGDCNATHADGCERDLRTDKNNCGTCGRACPGGGMTAHGTAQCSAGDCSFLCAENYNDCDGDLTNGCESNQLSDSANCGGCGLPCGDGVTCVNGACECKATQIAAILAPLDMYLMLDKSGSMQGPSWDSATLAIKNFIDSPQAAGAGVGLQFFPLDGMNLCSVDAYAQPVVGIAPLPGPMNAQSDLLKSALDAQTPDGGSTPTLAAVNGAYQFSSLWAMSQGDHKVIVVLATDGEPNDCDMTATNYVADVAMAATTALGAKPSIATYVIGVGSSTADLDTVAKAGSQNGHAFIVNNGDPSQFLAALNAIRASAIACEYTIPQPPNGQVFEENKVNVQYTPGMGQANAGMASQIPNVAGADKCMAMMDAWYYERDMNGVPTGIKLCSSTCGSLQKDVLAKVDILLGCTTEKK